MKDLSNLGFLKKKLISMNFNICIKHANYKIHNIEENLDLMRIDIY